MSKTILFVCNQGKHRSRTASELVENSKYAGIFSQKRPVTKELVKWADKIYVFTEMQKEHLKARFPSVYGKSLINLKIPDIYRYNQPELKDLLKEKLDGLV